MAELFQVKAIKVKKMRIPTFQEIIKNALVAEGKDTEKEYQKTVATWKGDKPHFESIIDITGGDASVLTGPTGSNEALRKFKFLDEGTALRWALMSQDWKSKTKPRKIKSGSGRGRPVIVGRRAMQARGIGPRPGIEAREWTETIGKRRKPKFTKRMVRAIQAGTARLYA
jgi:hypothetical protein